VIVVINPIREMAIIDDWAYFLTVRRLLETGQYQWHEWAAPNMPFQIYFGALFARALGVSFSSLRLSTLALMLVGFVSFYFLAREHRFSHSHAGLLALLLLASPLILKFSFSFLTNIPFLSCSLLALWLYTRGLRFRNFWLMLVGSLAAAMAILTRQFGIVFVPALLFAWAIDKDRKQLFPCLLAALIAPTLASAWQLYVGLASPSWAAALSRNGVAKFMAQPDVVPEILWRIAISLMYVSLFSLPLIIPAFVEIAAELRDARGKPATPRTRLNLILILVPALFILAMLTYGVFGMGKYGIMPILPWNFVFVSQYWPRPLPSLLTLIMVIGGVLLARLFALRYLPSSDTQKLPPHELLLDFMAVGFFIQQLLFFYFRDEYLLPLIPYGLIVIARFLGERLDRLRLAVVICSLVLLGFSTLWARGYVEETEAQWQAAEELVAAGRDPFEIQASWEWSSYHGAFDYYLQYLRESPEQQSDNDLLAQYFDVWLPTRLANASYLVGPLDAPPENPQFEIVKTVPYQDILFRTRFVYVLRRVGAP